MRPIRDPFADPDCSICRGTGVDRGMNPDDDLGCECRDRMPGLPHMDESYARDSWNYASEHGAVASKPTRPQGENDA